jgi:hypothetical protein
MTTCLVNERLQGSEIFELIKGMYGVAVKISSTLPANADMLITDCLPSLGIIIEENPLKGDVNIIVKRAIDLQKKFANSFTIIMNMSKAMEEELMLSIPLGSLRIILVRSNHEAFMAVTKIISAFRDERKLKMQDTFFTGEKEKAVQGVKARNIAKTFMKEMIRITDTECDLFMDALPSLSTLILQSQNPRLASSSPAEIQSINTLAKFFK